MATTYSDIQTTSTLPDALRAIYSREMMETIRPNLMYDQFSNVKRDFSAESGDTVYWTGVYDVPEAIGTLTENQDVDAVGMTDFRVSMTVVEKGFAMGTTKKLEVTTYWPGLSEIVRGKVAQNLRLTQDILARQALLAGANVSYPNGRTTRDSLLSTDKFTRDLNAQVRRDFEERDATTFDGVNIVAITHPRVIYDLRKDDDWVNANLYAGSTRIFNYEVGQIDGVRFLSGTLAKIPNGGRAAERIQTTLTGAHALGVTSLVVADTTGFAVGNEITLGTETTPTGGDVAQETVRVSAVPDGTHLTLSTPTRRAHANAEKVTEAPDVFPIIYTTPLGLAKGIALDPTIVVAPPTDKLRRMSYVGWYGIQAHKVLRDEFVQRLEVRAS